MKLQDYFIKKVFTFNAKTNSKQYKMRIQNMNVKIATILFFYRIFIIKRFSAKKHSKITVIQYYLLRIGNLLRIYKKMHPLLITMTLNGQL